MIDFYDINIYSIFLFGLLIGSFLNVVIYRLPRDMTISKGRSMCSNCKHELQWYDLFPLFSYLFLRGRCHYCKTKISIQYPLVEFFTGVTYTLIYSYIMNHVGYIAYYHILLFIIATLVIIGIYTDFLYHGTFDFSTVWVCGLYFIYLILSTKSLFTSLKLLVQSFTYFIPIIFIVLYMNFKVKGKWILALLSLVCLIFGAMFALINFPFNLYNSTLIINATLKWFFVCIFLILTDYIIKKCIKSNNLKNILSHIVNSLNFISYFLFLFNSNLDFLNKNNIQAIFKSNIFNVIIIILFILFYIFFIEIFNNHDNDEDLIDENDEIIDRNENIFTSYIGDGDLFILPFVGMVLGYSNVFSFYAILGLSVLSVYILIFRKGFNYVIPLYPYIILSIFVLL